MVDRIARWPGVRLEAGRAVLKVTDDRGSADGVEWEIGKLGETAKTGETGKSGETGEVGGPAR